RASCRQRFYDGWLALAEEAERRAPHGYLGPTPVPRTVVDPRLVDQPYRWWDAELTTVSSIVEDAALRGYADHAWRLARSAVGFFETPGLSADWRLTHQASLTATREGA